MKLLVSVRNAAEAQTALDAGVDLLDLKEPRSGSLGATDPQLWSRVVELVAGQVPVSAALGELMQYEPAQLHSLCAATEGISFAKIGLAGAAAIPDWPARWASFAAALPHGVQPVAVAYADSTQAQSPTVEEILQTAIELRWSTILIDTFDKQGGSLLVHRTAEQWGKVVVTAKRAGLRVLLAGSLDRAAIETIAAGENPPDFVAVRGAVCRGGREAELSGEAVREISSLLGACSQNPVYASKPGFPQ